MINYDVSPADLIARIRTTKPTWMAKAQNRKDQDAAVGRYTDGNEFWGEIKDVYIALQHEKCAYCEMKLAGKKYGSKVHEVEHFRPKSRVRAWPGKIKRLAGYVPPCATGGDSVVGYYLLAYNPFNYAIACTRCNSSLKSDYFPVKGKRVLDVEDAGKLKAEAPLLIYPISTIDVKPEDLITFIGVTAVPVHSSGYHHERARVTIDFFDLNHEDLTTRRAEVVAALYIALKGRGQATTPSDIREFDDHIEGIVSEHAAFSSCAKSYLALYETNKPIAIGIGKDAEKLRPR